MLLADVAQAWTLGIETPAARVLGERFWPGGLTLVLPVRAGRRPADGARGRHARRSASGCPTTTRPGRSPRALGPLPTTSANVSGEPDARDAQEIAERLGDALALVLDGGPIRGGPASTVVDCSVERPVIRRAGAIPPGQVAEALDGAGIGTRIEG